MSDDREEAAEEEEKRFFFLRYADLDRPYDWMVQIRGQASLTFIYIYILLI